MAALGFQCRAICILAYTVAHYRECQNKDTHTVHVQINIQPLQRGMKAAQYVIALSQVTNLESTQFITQVTIYFTVPNCVTIHSHTHTATVSHSHPTGKCLLTIDKQSRQQRQTYRLLSGGTSVQQANLSKTSQWTSQGNTDTHSCLVVQQATVQSKWISITSQAETDGGTLQASHSARISQCNTHRHSYSVVQQSNRQLTLYRFYNRISQDNTDTAILWYSSPTGY